jgi:integrase
MLNERRDEFTDAVIRKAKVKDKKYELIDDRRKGLRCVVFPNGRRSFILRYTRPCGPQKGESNSIKLLDWSPGTGALATVLDKYGEARDALAREQDPAVPVISKAQQDETVTVYLAQYRALAVPNMKPGTRSNVAPTLDRLDYALGNRNIRSITTKELLALIDARLASGPQAMVNERKWLSTFFSWCEGRGIERADGSAWISPMRLTKAPAKQTKRDRVLSDDELAEVWKGGHPFVQLLILSGCRRCEISDLRWNEVGREYLTLPGDRTKSGATHYVFITDAMRRVLDALPRTGKFVCNGSDRPLGGFSKLKNKLPALALPWTLHDLRRSFSTGLARLGVTQEVIDACTAHARGGVSATYNWHKYEKEACEGWKVWAEHVEAVVKAASGYERPVNRARFAP